MERGSPAEQGLTDGVAKERRMAGGALTTAGSLLWFLYSSLVIAGVVAAFCLPVENPRGGFDRLLELMEGFYAATVLVLVAAVLIALGLWVYSRGLPPIWKEARVHARLAAVLLLVYSVLGVIAMVAFAQLSIANGTGSVNPVTWEDWVAIYPVLWIAASVLLVVSAVFLSLFLRSQREMSVESTPLTGLGFLVYSLADVVGVVLFTVAVSWSTYSPPTPPVVVLHLTSITTFTFSAVALVEVTVVPVLGTIVFLHLLVQGLRLRTVGLLPHVFLDRIPSRGLRGLWKREGPTSPYSRGPSARPPGPSGTRHAGDTSPRPRSGGPSP